MISQPLCDIIMSFQGHGQAYHVPGDETSASIGQNGDTDFIEIYRERILESDYFYRSLEESVTVANPNDDGYFEFDQNCTTWQYTEHALKNDYEKNWISRVWVHRELPL